MDNLLLFADSYKATHYLQYPPGTTYLKAYFESRGGKFDRTLFYGLQYILKRYLTRRVTKEMVDEAGEFFAWHFGNDKLFNREGWDYIVNELGGKLPLKVKSVPEGAVVPVKNVLFTVESTDERVPWVVSYFETCLVQVWYPMTVATNSFMQKNLIRESMERTCEEGGADDRIKTMLHDFGLRGATSLEAAGIGGSAHLVNFIGSDTLPAIVFAREFYGPKDLQAGVSVPASEHSTMTA